MHEAKAIVNSKYRFTAGTDGRCSVGAGRRFVFTHQVAALFCVK